MFFVIWKCSDISMQGSYDSTEYVRGGVFGAYKTKAEAEAAVKDCEQAFRDMIGDKKDRYLDTMVVQAAPPTFDSEDKNSFDGWYGHAE